jgi:putative transcriptional regulator
MSGVINIRLNEMLDGRDISLYRLAKDTGIAYEALRKIRDGDVTRIYLDTLEKICVYLECEPGDLIELKK